MGYARADRWIRHSPLEYSFTTWYEGSQVTYQVTKEQDSWMVTRYVSGAAVSQVFSPQPTFLDAQLLAEADVSKGF